MPSRSTWSQSGATAHPAAIPSPDSTMQPSMTPSPSARAACAILIASRIPPDFASLMLIPCAISRAGGDVRERVAVLVDVDREWRRGAEAPRRPGRRRGAAARVLDAELGELRDRVERLVERPPLVHVDLRGSVGHRADGADALDVEPVAPAELQLQPPEARRGALRAARHVVRVAEPDRPRGRRAAAGQAEQPVDRDAEQLALKVVQGRVERRLRRLLARDLGEPCADLLERERVVAESAAVRSTKASADSGRLAVALDRRRLAPALDDPSCSIATWTTSAQSLRLAADHERLREVQPDDLGADFHRPRD